MKYNDYNWHDALIKNIHIDRANPGISDIITFEIEWLNENTTNVYLTFEEVYWVSMTLNFGIVAEESIYDSVELAEDNIFLVNFYAKWKGKMNGLKLKTYSIDLNSSGSQIIIIAKTFKLEKC